ncbi:MAG: ATP-binding cassette domain-containing protein [Candidatus Limnocylindria bacterium]
MLPSSTPDALWGAPPLRVLRPTAVACHDLRRRVRGRSLLDGVTLSVPAGARLLVVSRPDESASLLLRAIAGLARLDGGHVEVAGMSDPSRSGWVRRIGYVGPQPGLYPWMTPREALSLAARLHGLDREAADRRMSRLAEWVGVTAALETPISRGGPPLEQRVALAAALMSDPEVLLLDESLRALDPAERHRLLRFPPGRRAVLVASRYPASEEGLCSHFAFLANGRLALLAPLSRLGDERLPLSLHGIESLAAATPADGPVRPDRARRAAMPGR